MYLISTNNGLFKSATRRALNVWLRSNNLPTLGRRGKLIIPPRLYGYLLQIDGRGIRWTEIKEISAYNGLFTPIDLNTPVITRLSLAELLQRVSPPKAEAKARKAKNADRNALNLISKNNPGQNFDRTA
jgi:hypothetical protein